jgi:hypothetical protein
MARDTKIRRGFAADVHVYRCTACDKSVSKEVDRGSR